MSPLPSSSSGSEFSETASAPLGDTLLLWKGVRCISSVCLSLALQEKSAEDFPGPRPHGLTELGPGPVPVHRLGHVLLLHLEGGEIHRKGGRPGDPLY